MLRVFGWSGIRLGLGLEGLGLGGWDLGAKGRRVEGLVEGLGFRA